MKKIVLAFVVVTLVVAAAILFFNRQEHSPAGASLVPDSTILFAEIPNYQTGRGDLLRSPLSKMMQEADMRAFLDKPLGGLRQLVFGDSQETDFTRNLEDQLMTLPQGEVFVAITRLSVSPTFQVSTVIGADLKSQKLEAQAKLKLFEHQLQKYNPHLVIDSQTYLGTTYKIWQLNPTNQICHAFLGSMIVMADEEEAMRDIISRYSGQAGPEAVSLAASARYQNLIQGMPEERDGHVFLNINQLLAQYGMMLMMLPQGSGGLGGITDMEAAGTSVTFNEAGVTDVGVVTYKTNHLAEASIPLHTLAAAPGDSTLYHAGTTDLAGGYTKLMNLLAQSGNPNAMKIGSDLDKFLSDAHVRLADDFLAHLGPEVAYIGNWRQGARVPDFALVVEVRENAAISNNFEKIVKAVSQSAGTTDDLAYQGETFHVIHTESSYLSPTYVLTDKYFVLALSSDYAKEIVAQSKSNKASLADSEEYKRNMHLLPSIGSDVTYCDLRKLVGGVYSLAQSTVTNSDPSAILQADKLPKPATISRYLGTFVSTTTETEKTSITTAHSSIGKPVSAVVTLVGGFIAAQPWLAELNLPAIPGLPTMSSNTPVPSRPDDNQKAASQNQSRQ